MKLTILKDKNKVYSRFIIHTLNQTVLPEEWVPEDLKRDAVLGKIKLPNNPYILGETIQTLSEQLKGYEFKLDVDYDLTISEGDYIHSSETMENIVKSLNSNFNEPDCKRDVINSTLFRFVKNLLDSIVVTSTGLNACLN